jgi:plastocyanin
VDVVDNSFIPETVTTSRGSTVTWTWRGGAQHNVTFEDGTGSSATQTTGTLDRTFSAAGTFRYRCTIHSSSFTIGMVGAVVVQ